MCSEAFFATGTIRLWQTTPGTNYGLWQGPVGNGLSSLSSVSLEGASSETNGNGNGYAGGQNGYY